MLGFFIRAVIVALGLWLATVWVNGVSIDIDPNYGKLITIEDIPGLHHAIGLHIVTKPDEMSGEELYHNVCRGCHMMDAQGASGAGSYPSLAANRNLEAAGYPITMVVRGRRGMPPFGDMMNDAQIAAVVNYLRTHFGNSYSDVVTAQDVRDAR